MLSSPSVVMMMLMVAGTAADSAAEHSQVERLLEWRVLRAIAESDGALGSVRLQGLLLKQGYTLSQTTIGRLLNRLDQLSYTFTDGPKQGRRLTPLGEERLLELQLRVSSEKHERELLEAMRVRSVPEVLDALRVRQAIEGHTALLAATRVGKEQVEELRGMLGQARAQMAAGEHPLENNRLFHLKIAEFSGSRMLHSVLRFLVKNPRHLRMPPEIEALNLAVSLDEHEGILAAIAAGDAFAAQQRMEAHHLRTERMLEEYIATLGAGENLTAVPSSPR
ncbi:MAG: FCD domain-containing protein [Chloroflexi bacterium]|nr:FCD domain-containing protein [Chloroflexota bacterium]